MKTIAMFALALALSLAPAPSAAGSDVAYQVGEDRFQGYRAGEKDAPLVLLVHDWDGLTDYERRRADMLAALGYAVFAADLFGEGIRPESVDHRRALTGALYSDRERMRQLLEGAIAAAAAAGHDTSRVVAMGYCFGGAAILELARSGADLDGFVSFHGGLGTPEGQDYASARGRYLILHGSADSSVPLAQFAELGAALEAQGLEHELVSYGGAPHAWTVFGSERYREDADRKSWAAFIRFLRETFG